MEENDAQLQLKKRARRRLVGAVFFVSIVAVILPMVMDQEPRQSVQDVEIRIPGQDDKSFAPKIAMAPDEKPSVKPVEKPFAPPSESPVAALPPDSKVAEPAGKTTARVLEVVRDGKTIDKSTDKPSDKSADKPVEKPVTKVEKAPEKPAEKPAAKTPEKPQEKPADKAADKAKAADDAKRAAAILAGQGASDSKPVAKAGEYLVLIGAFSNDANVKNLRAKLSEQGIKTFVEPLDTPQGRKTRVRAGPFANRDAADKALQKMQHIGISGVVAAKP